MKHVRNFDRIEWMVRQPGDDQPFIFTSQREAFDMWRDWTGAEVAEFNIAEGYIRDVTDDFHEMDAEGAALARSLARHERSYSAGRL